MKTMPLIMILFFAAQARIPFNTSRQERVLLTGIDMNLTLDIAERELANGGWGSVLGMWALWDQRITAQQARRTAKLYFRHIEGLRRQFNIWHLTWAISNLYRSGNDEVRIELETAYQDAVIRASALHRVADRHVNGEKIYRGDIHFLGRRYSRRHLVVPGNRKYLQSVDEYRPGKKRDGDEG